VILNQDAVPTLVNNLSVAGVTSMIVEISMQENEIKYHTFYFNVAKKGKP
jgi:hypothetical protein